MRAQPGEKEAMLAREIARRIALDGTDEPFPPVRKPSLWRAWAPVVHSVFGFLSIGFGGLIADHHHPWLGAALMIIGGLLVWYSISGRSSHLRS